MPPYKQVEPLTQLCFMNIATDIHRLCVKLEEETASNTFSKNYLSTLARNLPSVIIEQMICKVIDAVHQTVKRNRKTVGIHACLDVLLQPHIHRLDLSNLFFKMRLPISINAKIQSIVLEKITTMSQLTSFNMVSNCDDMILKAIGTCCPNIISITISISDRVSDEGIKCVASKCQQLETLEIYKCWSVTSKGIHEALFHSINLRELHCDELGAVLITNFVNSDRIFKLTRFEQTKNPFEPTLEEATWIGKVCPDINMVRLYIDDEFLNLVPLLGKVRTLELEIAFNIGPGFRSAMKNLSETLTILQLSCETMSQEDLILIGKECKSLSTLHIVTANVEKDEMLKNDGDLFTSLTTLHLQVWKEAVINVECVEFFLLWCFKLVSIDIKAEMEFFTNEFLRRILNINPLKSTVRLSLTSDKYVPLTLESAYTIIGHCPSLELLSISSWDVSEEEYLQAIQYFKKNNLNFSIV